MTERSMEPQRPRYQVPDPAHRDDWIEQAPDEPGECGGSPDAFIDEIVWVGGIGLAYVDDEDEDDESGVLAYVDPNRVSTGDFVAVSTDRVRIATKTEVRAWFAKMLQVVDEVPKS